MRVRIHDHAHLDICYNMSTCMYECNCTPNHPMVDQLDRDWGCAALQWVKHLSNHRPVSFYRHANYYMCMCAD